MFRNTRELKFILPFSPLGWKYEFRFTQTVESANNSKESFYLFSFVINWRSQNMYHAGSLAAIKAGRNR